VLGTKLMEGITRGMHKARSKWFLRLGSGSGPSCRFFAAKPSPVAGVLPKQPAYPLCLRERCFHCGEHRLSQPIHAANLTGPRGQAREPTRGPRASRNRVQTLPSETRRGFIKLALEHSTIPGSVKYDIKTNGDVPLVSHATSSLIH
jgi:hypothetical protein